MIIVAFSDIHSCLDYLNPSSKVAEDIKNADIVLISGDITNFGDQDAAKEVFSSLRVYNDAVYAVPGNCDQSEVDQYLRQQNVNLNCNSIEYESCVIAGVGGLESCSRHKEVESTNEFFSICLGHVAEHKIDGKPLIFVSHFPPFNTVVDRTGMGKHAGMRIIREFIEDHQPLLSITGHIHEGVGIDKIGETTLVNPGSFRSGSYAVIEIEGRTVKAQIKQA